MFSKEELGGEEKIITNVVSYVFLPILVISVIGLYFKENSRDYIESKYKEANEYSFSGVVYEKKIEGGDGHRFPHYLFLNTGIRWEVNYAIYDKIQIGDSVVKKNKSDSVYYFKKNNQIIIEDQNFFLRQRYLTKLKQK